MNRVMHSTYIFGMASIVFAVTIYLAYTGYSYYILPIEERFFHPRYAWFKPSGLMGQGLGILGTFLIVFGVSFYIARKRFGFLSRWIRLKYLLEFHIFLCTLGPILVLFHTSFKFGGIVSIAFWSMVAVVASGVIGRFIYIQIPRTIEGREYSLSEIKDLRLDLNQQLDQKVKDDLLITTLIEEAQNQSSLSPSGFLKTFFTLKKIRRRLKSLVKDKLVLNSFYENIKKEVHLSQKIGRLQLMQKLFRYWHVAHLPFALIMIIIVTIHVIVTVSLGFKWIF